MQPARKLPGPGAPDTRKPLYYGWIIVAVCCFIILVTAGSRTGFGAFFNPMRREFGWSYSLTSLALSIAMFASGFLGPFGGYFFDRFGGRKVILGGIAIMGASTVLLSLTSHILYFIFMYGIVAAIGMTGAGPSVVVALGARWFRRRRAMALGLITAGLSAGGLVMVPLAAYLIQAMNWRRAWVVLGTMILGLGFTVAFVLLRDDPKDMGLLPDGDQEASPGAPSPQAAAVRPPLEAERWTAPLRSVPYWQITGAYWVCGVTTGIMTAHLIPYAQDKGMALTTAATAFGVMSALNIAGVVLATALADRFPRKYLLATVYSMRGLGYAVLLMAPVPWGIWGFAVIVGFSWIATLPLNTSLTADIYGLKYLGTLAGITHLVHQIGSAAAIQLAGMLRDSTGSYDLPFAIAGSLLLPAALASFSLNEKQYSATSQTVPAAPRPPAE
jgi:MFS family permease